jgi:uncharacterized phage-associated protein
MKEMPRCDQYKIVKTVFLADRIHLNQFGRPITFDNQWALRWGPVPSYTYDLIRNHEQLLKDIGLDAFPWTVEARGNIRYYTPTTEPDYDVLSKSDVLILDQVIARIKPLSFTQVHDLARNDKSYQEAWNKRGQRQALPMRFDLLIEEQDQEIIEEICMDMELAK